MTTKGKVLVLVSSGHRLPLKDGKVTAMGPLGLEYLSAKDDPRNK